MLLRTTLFLFIVTTRKLDPVVEDNFTFTMNPNHSNVLQNLLKITTCMMTSHNPVQLLNDATLKVDWIDRNMP